jgi:hypothetical protein
LFVFTLSDARPSLQDRFAATLLGLCEEAGAQGLRHRLMAPLLGLLCRRLHGVIAQVTRTLARLQAGRWVVRRGRQGVVGVRSARPSAVPSGGLRLRYGWAWMIRMAPRVAQYAPQVQMLLDDAEMQAALAASPSLRRALRPLCRGLAFPAPPVMADTFKARSRPGTRHAVDGPAAMGRDAGADSMAGIGAGMELGSPPIRPMVSWPADAPPDSRAPSAAIPERDARPGGRASPRLAPAVLRLFMR